MRERESGGSEKGRVAHPFSAGSGRGGGKDGSLSLGVQEAILFHLF